MALHERHAEFLRGQEAISGFSMMEVARLSIRERDREVVVPAPFLCFEDVLIGLDNLPWNAVVLGLPIPQRAVIRLDHLDLGIDFLHLPDHISGAL